MGEKDTRAKEYLANNERFADLCNAVLFSGKQIIRPENLEERDTTEVLSVMGIAEKNATHQQKWRDLLKHVVVRYTNGSYIVLVGIENQSDVHYAMPVKNMSYDVSSYEKQMKEVADKHRKNKDHPSDSGEFLSGFYKTDHLIPVITITVYWGADEWDGPRSLYEMFDDSTDFWKPFVSDYRLNLVIPGEIENFEVFHTSLGYVLETIKVSNDKEMMKHFFETNEVFSQMDNESIQAINTFTGLKLPANRKGDTRNMFKSKGVIDWENEILEKERHEKIQKMIQMDFSKDVILRLGYSEEEYERAEKEAFTSV
jgi:hypothetical protein